MSKLTLLSIVLAMVLAPLLTGSDRSPQRGLKRALLAFFAFNLFYVLLIKFVELRGDG
jgi:hypothetical protein